MTEEKFAERAEKLAKKAEKPGFLTSEFWLAAATTTVGLLIKAGILASETSGIAQAISSIMVVAGPVVYILARSGVKKGLAEVLAYLAESAKKK